MTEKLARRLVSECNRHLNHYILRVLTPCGLGWRLIALALAALLATGCSDDDRSRNPVRVLAPAIRAHDLVRWCDDAGVALDTAQWIEADTLHDKYLAEVLALRTHARERLNDLFKPFDGDEHPTLDLELRTERAAAAVSRDFFVQLTSLDDAFIASLCAARVLTAEVAQSIVARRQLERVNVLFAVATASGESPLVAGNPDPLQFVFESWPEGAPRDTHAICAWTKRTAELLLPTAQTRWKLRCAERASYIAAELAEDDPAASLDHNAQVSARRLKSATQTRTAALDAIRIMRLALSEDAAGIPPQARTDAMHKLMLRLASAATAAALERAYATACEIAATDATLVAQIRLAREKWRLERSEWIAGTNIDEQDDARSTTARFTELLARMPDEQSKEAVNTAFTTPPNSQVAEAVVDDQENDAAIDKYVAIRKIGLISSPPPKHFLRTIARMAHLDEDQERLFIDDVQASWRALMLAETQRIERAEESLSPKAAELWRDPLALSRAIDFAIGEVVTAPLANADALDAELVQTLIARTAAFGGQAEPAATLWRVVRALPADGWRDGAGTTVIRGNNDDFRVYLSGAHANVGVLACETQLSPITRTVLLDLIVAHQNELVEAAHALRAARSGSIGPIFRAIVQQQTDPSAGKRSLFSALRDFQQVCKAFEDLQDSIVEEAAAVLPANDAQMLRYRRAELLSPELFVESGSHFAADRARARALVQSLIDQGATALQVQLELDDLALRADIFAALERDIDAQPTTKTLNRLYRQDERLAEQSLRRLDRAARAARDARNASSQRR